MDVTEDLGAALLTSTASKTAKGKTEAVEDAEAVVTPNICKFVRSSELPFDL